MSFVASVLAFLGWEYIAFFWIKPIHSIFALLIYFLFSICFGVPIGYTIASSISNQKKSDEIDKALERIKKYQ